MKIVYLDHAATTPLAPEVRAAMRPWLDEDYGNPSSVHPPGVRAKEAIEEARAKVARAVGARAKNVIFTSGGTEADNMAVLGAARARGDKALRRIVIGPTEHPAVLESAAALRDEGFEVLQAPLARGGALDLDAFEALLDPQTCLVAQMLVSNELGTIYPVRELARRVRRRAPNAHLHVDAVQALGKLELSIEDLGVDSLALSAHKVHAPKGTGALVLHGDPPLRPIVFGGGQEGKRRPGTENVAGIVALGVAAEAAEAQRTESLRHAAELRRQLLQGLERIPSLDGVRALEPGAEAEGVVPTILALRLPGAPSEVWLHHLETHGVMTSTGSACNAGAGEVSASYRALGLDAEESRHILRVSFSRLSTDDDVVRAIAAFAECSAELEAALG